nr:GAF domain-containing protein [Acidobacteriota bacterium]
MSSSSKLAIKEMETLRQLALEITSELDRNKLLLTIIRSAMKLLGVSGGGVYEYAPASEQLKVVADCGAPSSIEGHTLKIGEGLAGQVLKNRKGMKVDDYGSWKWRSSQIKPELFKAVAADILEAPGGRILGVLYVTNDVEGRPFSDRDMVLLSLLASHAAIAMRNAEILTEKQLSLTQLELTNKFDESIRAAFSLKRLLEITLEEALQAVGAVDGSVMILDHERNVLEIGAGMVQGEYRKKEHPVFAIGQGIAGRVAATGDEYYCRDTLKDDLYQRSFTGRNIRSILSVPIVSRGLVLGVVSADSDKTNAFDDDNLKTLKTLANHVAQAIESQRFRDVAISLSTLSEDKMYRNIVKNACVLTGTEASTMFLRDGLDIKRAAVFTLMPLPAETASEGVRDSGITRRILATGKPEIISDAQTHPDVKPSMKARGIKSLMGVPLNVRLAGEGDTPVITIGVLFVSTMQQRDFGERDREILQSLASQAAIAITKTRLHEEATRERDSASRLASQLFTLNNITEEMQAEPDLSRLIDLISQNAARLLNADAGGILLTNSVGSRLTFMGSYGLSGKYLEAVRDAEGGTPVADSVVESGAALIINDIKRDQRFSSPIVQEEGIRATLSTPLLVKNKIIGTLDVYSKTKPQPFDDEARQILSLLANQAALAIENTRVSQFQQSLLSSAFDAIIAVDDA